MTCVFDYNKQTVVKIKKSQCLILQKTLSIQHARFMSHFVYAFFCLILLTPFSTAVKQIATLEKVTLECFTNLF